MFFKRNTDANTQAARTILEQVDAAQNETLKRLMTKYPSRIAPPPQEEFNALFWDIITTERHLDPLDVTSALAACKPRLFQRIARMLRTKAGYPPQTLVYVAPESGQDQK